MPTRKTRVQTVVVAINATESTAIQVGFDAIVGIIMPATLTATAITFKVSADGVTWVALYDATNTQVSVTVAASRAYGLSGAVADALAPWSLARLELNGAGEAAARSIVVCLK